MQHGYVSLTPCTKYLSFICIYFLANKASNPKSTSDRWTKIDGLGMWTAEQKMENQNITRWWASDRPGSYAIIKHPTRNQLGGDAEPVYEAIFQFHINQCGTLTDLKLANPNMRTSCTNLWEVLRLRKKAKTLENMTWFYFFLTAPWENLLCY